MCRSPSVVSALIDAKEDWCPVKDMLRWLHRQKPPFMVLDDAKQAEEFLKKAQESTRPGAYTIPSWAIAQVLREKAVAK